MRRILIIIQLQTLLFGLWAQEVRSTLSYDQIFDNREYFTDYAYSQTIFASRINGSFIFNVDSTHSFIAGLNYMLEMGSEPLGVLPTVNLYYRFDSERLQMFLGSFERRDKLCLPNVFITDTINYFRPNIEGALIQYSLPWLKTNAYIDWTGRIGENRRESFLLGLDSRLDIASFYLHPSFLMYHNAKTSTPSDGIHIQDNGVMMLLAGYTFEREEKLSGDFAAGILSSYNRIRPSSFEWSSGVLFNMNAQYRQIGLKGTYYYGEPVNFTYGDPFYSYGNYGRADLYLDPFRSNKVKTTFAWCFHVLPGEGLFHSQQILIHLEF